jgi:hypothetical protein
MGAWSSGGGELVKDADNPWFLQNTKEVRYCIKVDRENFHVSEGAIDRSIHAALDYWKKEFAKAFSPAGMVVLGTQKFLKTACSSGTDLAFQFGHLNGELIERIAKKKSIYLTGCADRL